MSMPSDNLHGMCPNVAGIQVNADLPVSEGLETTDASTCNSDGGSGCSSPLAGMEAPQDAISRGCSSRPSMSAQLQRPMLLGTRNVSISGKSYVNQWKNIRIPAGTSRSEQLALTCTSFPLPQLVAPTCRTLHLPLSPPARNAPVPHQMCPTHAPGVVCHSTPLHCHAPISPRRQAREAIVARARCEGVPLKVRLPSYATPSPSQAQLDPARPVKKRVVFHELANITAEVMSRLQPFEPAKKQPTKFLLADPPRVMALRALQLPPGLFAVAR